MTVRLNAVVPRRRRRLQPIIHGCFALHLRRVATCQDASKPMDVDRHIAHSMWNSSQETAPPIVRASDVHEQKICEGTLTLAPPSCPTSK